MIKKNLPTIRLPHASDLNLIRNQNYNLGLHTVCREAKCPNQAECASNKTAAFLLLGGICSRNCGFCSVDNGRPEAPDPDEGLKIAGVVSNMALEYVVLTSVTRDDLEDGGASVFVDAITKIKEIGAIVEVLIPDFKDKPGALERVIAAEPDVINHNIETIKRLYPQLRRGANYEGSLNILRRVKESGAQIFTKTGIMVGLGETGEELEKLIRDLAAAGCDALLIGQYLQPTSLNFEVRKYYTDEEFSDFENIARRAGFKVAFAGPLVRSSYRAGVIYHKLME